MPTRRVPKQRNMRRRINDAAIAAWKAGDTRGCHEALDLAPFEYSPVPRRFGAYGLPDEPTGNGTVMDGLWPKIKKLQDELYRVAGEPGIGRTGK